MFALFEIVIFICFDSQSYVNTASAMLERNMPLHKLGIQSHFGHLPDIPAVKVSLRCLKVSVECIMVRVLSKQFTSVSKYIQRSKYRDCREFIGRTFDVQILKKYMKW